MMNEKKTTIRGFENKTIEDYTQEKSEYCKGTEPPVRENELLNARGHEAVSGRKRPEAPAQPARTSRALLELREKYGDDQGTI